MDARFGLGRFNPRNHLVETMEKNLLIQSARVVDPNGPHHGKVLDVRIHEGVVVELGKDLPHQGEALWRKEGACVSPGWFDGQAHFRDPGEEVKEGLESGALAGQMGGFTDVAILPSTTPALDHKAEIHYLHRRAEGLPVTIHPIGALSSGLKGTNLAELHDLHQAGVVGFYDDGPIEHPELLRRGLEYASDMGVAVWSLPLEGRLNAGAVMHEGSTSTELGLTGSPEIVETMRLHRDLEITRYTGGRLHVPLLTTAAGVDMIRQAKAEGLRVSCSVSAHHLMFCDTHMQGFNGTLRNRMPFRSESDRDALRQGVLDGTIDAIVSDHRPEDLEHHDVEFMLAPDGISGIETAFSVAVSSLGAEQVDHIVRAFTHGPRSIMHQEALHLEQGTEARITWFDPQGEYAVPRVSRAVNVPAYDALLGKALTGTVLGTVCGKNGVKLLPAGH